MCPFKMMNNPRFGKAVEVLIWIAALALIVTNVALFRQNRQLREAAAPQIAAGEQLQMLSGVTLDGRIEPINLPGANSKLLLLTFSPGCPACQANQEGWAKLANALEQKVVRVLWLSRDPVEVTRKYCLMHGITPSDFVVSSVPVFAGSKACSCFSSKCGPFGRGCRGEGGCSFDKNTSQCVNVSCSGICL
jgi:hypothetical protein